MVFERTQLPKKLKEKRDRKMLRTVNWKGAEQKKS